jgi:hypothetical protein
LFRLLTNICLYDYNIYRHKRNEERAMVATTVLAKVDGKRLERAAEGLMSGAYEVVLSHRAEGEIRGVVRKKLGKAYGGGAVWMPYNVMLTDTLTSCSCPDSFYRGATCKHCVALALYVPGAAPGGGA